MSRVPSNLPRPNAARRVPDQNGLAVDAAGCRRLWCALILQEFQIATQPQRPSRRREIEDARAWFASASFHGICALIGLDGGWMAQGAAAAFARIDAQGGRPPRAAQNRWDDVTVQAILDMCNLLGLSNLAIAERIGVSPRVVAGVLARARDAAERRAA